MNLTPLQDATFIVAGINLINTLVNIYWTVRLKAIQGNNELIRSLTDQNKAKDEVIKTLELQHKNLNSAYKKLEGENLTYRKFNNHTLVD